MNLVNDIKILTGTEEKNKPVKTQQQKTILVVEDEKPLSEILEKRLLEEGYQVITAANGEQGLEMATSHHPDVILLDLLMPVMDGKSMLARLRQIPDCKKTPVIVLTNAGEIDNIRDTQTYLDAVEFLIKSNVTIDQIIQKVNTFSLATYI